MLKLSFLFVALYTSSCEWHKYPPEKYEIPVLYRRLISSFNPGDTLKFRDSSGALTIFKIDGIDSVIHDTRGHFINQREYKDIKVNCREITSDAKAHEPFHMILINRYPDEDAASFDVKLKTFYSRTEDDPFILQNDTIIANGISFTNYYAFRHYDYRNPKKPGDVVNIYMTEKDGIIAYRLEDGKWWVKLTAN